ncbi:DUF3429 domain-containing protein [Maritalea sp.]|uniref:DUF3429 domain-containing protein n=1 Tax=Maritalea sp. TaxID=2003361 RepID=UPI003EF65605
MSNLPLFWSRTVAFAALAGWIPFLLGLLFTLIPAISPFESVMFERALVGYGALILSFLGGIRWGIRLQGGAGSELTYIVGTFGAIAGFVMLLMPVSVGLVLLTFGFAAHGIWDVLSGMRGRVPQSYARLRAVLTWLVCVTLILIIIARFF